MNLDKRLIDIYSYVRDHGETSISDLVNHFKVSPITIRRALKPLEAAGLLEHLYGKARIIDTEQKEKNFSERMVANHSAKQYIARLALSHIVNNSYKSIFVDGSTSVLELVRLLPVNNSLTVFTNSFPILEALREKTSVQSFFIGGFVDWQEQCASGEIAEDMCKGIYVDATITSCGGFSEVGTVNNGYVGSPIRRIMMMNCSNNILLADNSKFNRKGIFKLMDWSNLSTLITDRALPESFCNTMQQQNVTVIW